MQNSVEKICICTNLEHPYSTVSKRDNLPIRRKSIAKFLGWTHASQVRAQSLVWYLLSIIGICRKRQKEGASHVGDSLATSVLCCDAIRMPARRSRSEPSEPERASTGTACSFATATTPSILLETRNIPKGDVCPSGGIEVVIGYDDGKGAG